MLEPRRSLLGIRVAGAVIAALAASGCATRGPLHVYVLDAGQPASIRDYAADGRTPAVVASFLQPGEELGGFAYDPFTDHFFLRLASTPRVRVVDRPAARIKREFSLPAAAEGRGDLAVRPRDGHLFFSVTGRAVLVETDRAGRLIREIGLPDVADPVVGVAYDGERDRLLVLSAGKTARLSFHDSGGRLLDAAVLSVAKLPGPLAYHPAAREIFTPDPTGRGMLVFDERGALLRRAALAGEGSSDFLDVGERSFVRVF